MRESRPSWQRDACPRWCAGGHHELDHPDDRVHRSASTGVATLAQRTLFEGAQVRRAAEATEFEVALSCVDGQAETWLYVGDGPGRSIDVSAESGARLLREMTLVLAQLD